MTVSLVLNDIDDATAEWLKSEAERKGVSVESLAAELIRKDSPPSREEPALAVYHDLDDLAGTWTEDQATEFLNAVNDFESIDERQWP